MGTAFSKVYNTFFSKITDDLYLEITPKETVQDLQNLLIFDAIPGFEFPRKNLSYNIEQEERPKSDIEEGDFIIEESSADTEMCLIDTSSFAEILTPEEINILAILMKEAWVQRQLTSVENTRMKYSGPDFKFTSQANHLQKLQALLTECRRDSLHYQRLYKRRQLDTDGKYKPNWEIFDYD